MFCSLLSFCPWACGLTSAMACRMCKLCDSSLHTIDQETKGHAFFTRAQGLATTASRSLCWVQLGGSWNNGCCLWFLVLDFWNLACPVFVSSIRFELVAVQSLRFSLLFYPFSMGTSVGVMKERLGTSHLILLYGNKRLASLHTRAVQEQQLG